MTSTGGAPLSSELPFTSPRPLERPALLHRAGQRHVVVLFLLFLLSIPAITPRIYASDEVQYFAFLRSLWFDRDVSFDNEYRYFYDDAVHHGRPTDEIQHQIDQRLALQAERQKIYADSQAKIAGLEAEIKAIDGRRCEKRRNFRRAQNANRNHTHHHCCSHGIRWIRGRARLGRLVHPQALGCRC